MNHEEFGKYAKNGTLNLNGKEEGGIRDHPELFQKNPTFFKDIVKFLSTRADIHTLNLSNFDLGLLHIKELREALQIKPLEYITTLNLSDNPNLCAERAGESGIKEVEKLTEKHFPNLQVLKAQDIFLLTPPDEIKEFTVNIQKNFPKSLILNISLDPKMQELKDQLCGLTLTINNPKETIVSAGADSNNKVPPLKRSRVDSHQSINRSH